MKSFSKKEYVIAHLLAAGHISSWQAINNYQHARLSTVIHELRNAGAAIKTVDEPHVGGTHARYHVIDQSTVLNTLTPRMRENVEFLMKAANDPNFLLPH
ncbi:winged helix domain-containing protein [Bacterioplanoides pacificum]|uniref:Helix-turn-helix domain-containing protein n=1 Tax=Bacterioplanoides pacificum TaxID=1171596 RepID=A0ABV7VNH6_9GAMM